MLPREAIAAITQLRLQKYAMIQKIKMLNQSHKEKIQLKKRKKKSKKKEKVREKKMNEIYEVHD